MWITQISLTTEEQLYMIVYMCVSILISSYGAYLHLSSVAVLLNLGDIAFAEQICISQWNRGKKFVHICESHKLFSFCAAIQYSKLKIAT